MKGVFLHVMADTLGSVGVIISTLLIDRYGWTGFDPLASIFIAVLIFASVVPLVVDSGRLLVLDMGEEREAEVKRALLAVSNSASMIASIRWTN
jgi:zinc transporter 5/7